MIEKYRKPSEDKWRNIIQDIDDGKEWCNKALQFIGGIYTNGRCGYCVFTHRECTATSCACCDGLEIKKLSYEKKCPCTAFCNLQKNDICKNGGKDGLFRDFINAMDDDDRIKARVIAVKIYEFIKADVE